MNILESKTSKVKISVATLKQRFQICEPVYIQKVCKGRCCEGTDGLMVSIHDSEIQKFEKLGIRIKNGFMVDSSKSGVCPFKKNHLCAIHSKKPFGCKASPFTLTRRNTLIIRNRYRLLRCYRTSESVPAYIAHRRSLEQIFGVATTDKIVKRIKAGDSGFCCSNYEK